MLSGQAGQSYLGMGEPYLLTSVAVVALGGASFAGGRGHFLGTLGGALLLSVLITLLMTFQLPEAVRTIVQGVVILASVIVAKVGFRSRVRRNTSE
jgi:ribose transport system permease protein